MLLITKNQKEKFNKSVLEKYSTELNDFSDLLGDGYDEMSGLFYAHNKKFLHWLDSDPDKAVYEKEIKSRQRFYKLLQKIGSGALKCTQVIENKEPIVLPDKPVLFVANHGFHDDILATVLAAGRHAYLVIGSLPLLYNAFDGAALAVVGCVILNRKNKHSRAATINKCQKVMEYGTDIMLFPEGGWNKTSEKPVLNLWKGVYTLSCAVKCDVVPITHYVRDMEILDKKNVIHTFMDKPIPLYEFSETDALIRLREVMATRQWELMEKYGVSTRTEEMNGFSSSDEKWHAHLRERMKGVARYDSSIEKRADYRPKDIVLPEEAFRNIADISDVSPCNIKNVIFARKLLVERNNSDFQRLY